jgi:hypothetical protein
LHTASGEYGAGEQSLSLFDAMDREVRQIDCTSCSINISDLAAGICLLKFTFEGGSLDRKLIKK